MCVLEVVRKKMGVEMMAVLKVVMELVPKEAQARTMERMRRLLDKVPFLLPS